MIPENQTTKQQDNNENIINLPAQNAKRDPAGTDPNRYSYISVGTAKSTNQEPDTPDDESRMLNPNRGEH